MTSCSSCYGSQNKCKTSIIESNDDPSTLTSGDYDPKVKYSFVPSSFGANIVGSTGKTFNSVLQYENAADNYIYIYKLGLDERIANDETFIFNKIKIYYSGLITPGLPPPKYELQFGIYKIVDNNTTPPYHPGKVETYDYNSKVITKSKIVTIDSDTKVGFMDIEFEELVTINDDKSDYFILTSAQRKEGDTNENYVTIFGNGEHNGQVGYKYYAQIGSSTDSVPLPDTIPGDSSLNNPNNVVGVGADEAPTPYLNLYFDHRLLC